LKTKLIYGATFLLAFVAVSGLLIVLNQKYENIFQFNFNEKKSVSSLALKSDTTSTNELVNNQNNISDQTNELDSIDIQNADSVNIDTSQSSIVQIDSIQLKNEKDISKLQTEIPKMVINSKDNSNVNRKSEDKQKVQNQIVSDKQQNQFAQVQENNNIKSKSTEKDSAYIKWKKSTVKLYELMDPKKAAKIISSQSDNIARDLIYSMNKKKAAKILQYLNTETVIKLTRVE